MVHGTRRIPSDLVSALLAGWERASSMPVLLLDPTRGISVFIVVNWVLSSCCTQPCETDPSPLDPFPRGVDRRASSGGASWRLETSINLLGECDWDRRNALDRTA